MAVEPIQISIAVEDELSESVIRRILGNARAPFDIIACYGKKGSGYLQKKIHSFYEAAKYTPFIVLMDLDRGTCPAGLIGQLLRRPPYPNFLFRIAVREVESWLLADKKGIAQFLRVSQALIPRNPDLQLDPKQDLINLARKSRNREIREDIVPTSEHTSIGPGYNSVLARFVSSDWNFREGCLNSDSLRRFCQRVDEFRPV